MCHGVSKVKADAKQYTYSLDNLIIALCRDFERRALAIESGSCNSRTAVEYKYYNYKILEGAIEIAGPNNARTFVYEIGHKVGFAKSKIDCMSEVMYKSWKMDVKMRIAQKLHLLD